MNLEVARRLVARLAAAWLDWKVIQEKRTDWQMES
jgi:hypothetical protein